MHKVRDRQYKKSENDESNTVVVVNEMIYGKSKVHSGVSAKESRASYSLHHYPTPFEVCLGGSPATWHHLVLLISL